MLRHCVAVTKALIESRVIDTSHTASPNLSLAPHPPPRGLLLPSGKDLSQRPAIFTIDEIPAGL